jgi:hypothetical protein
MRRVLLAATAVMAFSMAAQVDPDFAQRLSQ